MKYRLPRFLWAGTVLLVANAGYLAATGSPTLFYIGNVIFHLLFGVGLGALFLIFALRYLQGAYGEPTGAVKAGVGVLLASLGFAAYIAVVGTTQPDRWALHAHIATAVIGLGVIAGDLLGGAIFMAVGAIAHAATGAEPPVTNVFP